ncbi:MAG: hypothetical protein M5U31_13080 [Acidimicrobiia bacterium]|nr:hypothetical protein [Acidimicrobiia bacterium]
MLERLGPDRVVVGERPEGASQVAGGGIGYSRLSRPDEPPSSATLTTAVTDPA